MRAGDRRSTLRPEGLEPPSSSLEDSCLILLDHGRTTRARHSNRIPWGSRYRDDWTRTSDPCVPNAMLYQAELRPEALPPTELFGRSAPVTVRAPDFTFCDLRRNPSPTHALCGHRSHVVDFIVTDVIELQHADVGFTAVYARMRKQILSHEDRVSLPISLLIDISPAVVKLRMTAIMSLRVFTLTGAAVRCGRPSHEAPRKRI